MRLLDLFCGAGGAAEGYRRAGFGSILGVDIRPQSNYPFHCVQMDVFDYLAQAGALEGFDFIHASPPCQEYTPVSGRAKKGQPDRYPDLLAPTRAALADTGLPYVIENVESAPILKGHAVRLCGSSFGLDVRRHRWFESNLLLLALPCQHVLQAPRFRSLDSRQKTLSTVVGVHGHLNYPGELELRKRAMGIGWMTSDELSQAIPPAYTEFIGKQVLEQLAKVA